MKLSFFKKFRLTNAEWLELEKKFSKLCYFASWQLLKKNIKNSHTNELEDIEQELKEAIVQAGVYYKRQLYIETCFKVIRRFITEFSVELNDLETHWQERKNHGANRQRFGKLQEEKLQKLLEKYVPDTDQPDTNQTLVIDTRFLNYCKSIIWNKQKTLGKTITKERSLRNGQVSLSNFPFFCER